VRGCASNGTPITVSAIMARGHHGAEVIAPRLHRYNLALGAGLSKVAGKLFRIGHLGDLNELMLLGALAGAELAMLDVGVKIERGAAWPLHRNSGARMLRGRRQGSRRAARQGA